MHYSEKHIYCSQCNELVTDEDALQKHNIRQHSEIEKQASIDDTKSVVKQEPVYLEELY